MFLHVILLACDGCGKLFAQGIDYDNGWPEYLEGPVTEEARMLNYYDKKYSICAECDPKVTPTDPFTPLPADWLERNYHDAQGNIANIIAAALDREKQEL